MKLFGLYITTAKKRAAEIAERNRLAVEQKEKDAITNQQLSVLLGQVLRLKLQVRRLSGRGKVNLN